MDPDSVINTQLAAQEIAGCTQRLDRVFDRHFPCLRMLVQPMTAETSLITGLQRFRRINTDNGDVTLQNPREPKKFVQTPTVLQEILEECLAD